MDEHVLSAVIADHEAKPLLRVEELDHALAFADDLRGHAAAAASAEATAPAATAATAAEAWATTTACASAAATIAAAAAAEAITAAAAESVTAGRCAEPAAACGNAAAELFTAAKTIALVTAASAALTLTPSIETHGNSNSLVPRYRRTNALGPRRNRPYARKDPHARFQLLQENYRESYRRWRVGVSTIDTWINIAARADRRSGLAMPGRDL